MCCTLYAVAYWIWLESALLGHVGHGMPLLLMKVQDLGVGNLRDTLDPKYHSAPCRVPKENGLVGEDYSIKSPRTSTPLHHLTAASPQLQVESVSGQSYALSDGWSEAPHLLCHNPGRQVDLA